MSKNKINYKNKIKIGREDKRVLRQGTKSEMSTKWTEANDKFGQAWQKKDRLIDKHSACEDNIKQIGAERERQQAVLAELDGRMHEAQKELSNVQREIEENHAHINTLLEVRMIYAQQITGLELAEMKTTLESSKPHGSRDKKSK